jgi:hypothetical protein
MALTRQANQPAAGQTRYRFDYFAATAIIDKKADQAAHYFFDLGDGDHGEEGTPRFYTDLSLVEKLAILDKRVLSFILDASKSYKATTDAEAARLAAIEAEESELVT